jgi:cadmium resistance protein CadD (predicted permease)
MERSVYVFNITVITGNGNIDCHVLHFVTINVAVCIKPLQYHMYGVFLLSLNRARPLRRTARLHPPVNFVTHAVFGIITITN